MTKFIYKARDSSGKIVTGVREAVSEKDAASSLAGENLIAVSIEPEKGKRKKSRKKQASLFGSRIKDKDVAVFCRQFSTMIGAGVSVAEALEDLSHSVDNPALGKVLAKSLEDVRGGSSLSKAFSRHGSVFSGMFVSMVAAGEESGKLSTVTADLSVYLEKKIKLKGQLRSASMYPAFVAGFFALIIAGLVFFLVPQFKNLFDSVGAAMPLPTRITIAVSEFMVRNVPFVLIALVLAVVALIAFYKSDKGKLYIDSFLLQLPLFGPIIKKIMLARFFHTLATLLKSGIDVVGALDIASKVTNNSKIEKQVEKMKTGIVKGSSLSDGLRSSVDIFPRLTASMASVGEKSGSLDEMLVKISDYFTDEVDSDVEGFSSLIEPVLIISLGLVVGFFVITMYLPIFQMAGAVAGGM